MLQFGASNFISKFTHQLFQELPTASCGLQQMEFAQLDVLTCLEKMRKAVGSRCQRISCCKRLSFNSFSLPKSSLKLAKVLSLSTELTMD